MPITGQKFNLLTAIRFSHRNKNRQQYWIFLCDCGAQKSILLTHVNRGKTMSCGCHRKNNRTIHGNAHHPLYDVWYGMINRCYNKSSTNYRLYGERGITVCDEWRYSLDTFIKDMGDRPSKKHTIDRIDCNGNYSIDNCRWASTKEQSRNKRNTFYIEYKGYRRPLIDVCDEFGLKYDLAHNRIHRLGWTVERALETPIRNTQRWTGQTAGTQEISNLQLLL